jgi:hypothetical protein
MNVAACATGIIDLEPGDCQLIRKYQTHCLCEIGINAESTPDLTVSFRITSNSNRVTDLAEGAGGRSCNCLSPLTSSPGNDYELRLDDIRSWSRIKTQVENNEY